MEVEIIFVGIAAGLLAGMFGVGGGIIIVPSLILIFGWNLPLATGTSLATLLLPTGFLALLQYKRANLLHLKSSALIASGIIFGNILGASIALNSTISLLKQLFGIFQMAVGIKYFLPLFSFRNRVKNSIKNGKKIHSNEPIFHSKINNGADNIADNIKNYVFIFIGISAGLLGGLFGIGGGIIITTVLISGYKINPKQAVAMSLAAMFLPVGLGGVLLYNQNEFVNFSAAIILAIGVEIGSAISAKFAIKINSGVIKIGFGFLFFVMGLYFLLQKYFQF